MELSIVIPVYRSEKILPMLIQEIVSEMNKNGTKQYEVILVNDCSPDASWHVIQNLCALHPQVKGINLRKNTGQHNAIMAGLNNAEGNVVVMMDDDLQHSPRYIKPLSEKVMEGYDVCYAKFCERKHSLWKVWGSKFNDKAAAIMLGKPKNIYMSPFKAVSGDMKNEIIKYSTPFAYVDGFIFMITQNVTSIDVAHNDRFEGTGNYDFWQGVLLWMKMATNFSIVPLRIASLFGLLSAFVGFLMAVVLVISKLTMNVPVLGWSSLIVTILLLGGIQLFTIGIIGEYIGRTYININKKPQYVIKNKMNF